jgi:hypothetical protein
VAILPERGPADFAMPGEIMQWFFKARKFGDYRGFDPTKQTLLEGTEIGHLEILTDRGAAMAVR